MGSERCEVGRGEGSGFDPARTATPRWASVEDFAKGLRKVRTQRLAGPLGAFRLTTAFELYHVSPAVGDSRTFRDRAIQGERPSCSETKGFGRSTISAKTTAQVKVPPLAETRPPSLDMDKDGVAAAHGRSRLVSARRVVLRRRHPLGRVVYLFDLAAAGDQAASSTSTAKALLAGGAIALFAFTLATLSAWHRDRRSRRRRDRVVVTALRAEVQALRPASENDLNLVRHELMLLPSKNSIVNPLDPLGSDFFELVRVDPPRLISQDPELLVRLRDVARRTRQVDEMIRAREAYRAANQAVSNFTSTLRAYDELIERWLTELLDALDALDAALKELRA